MLICIDFQPAYEEAFLPLMDALRRRLRIAAEQGEEVHFIYNHARSLEGEELGDPADRLLSWAEERDLPLAGARLIVKNFGWVSHQFRFGVERGVAVSILREVMKRGLTGSHELPPAELERIVATSHGHFPGFWDCSEEAWDEIRTGAIAMPYRFESDNGSMGMTAWLESLVSCGDRRIEITGGYRERCLDEICMMLDAMGIRYGLDQDLMYGLPFPETVDSPSGDVLVAHAPEFPFFAESEPLTIP